MNNLSKNRFMNFLSEFAMKFEPKEFSQSKWCQMGKTFSYLIIWLQNHSSTYLLPFIPESLQYFSTCLLLLGYSGGDIKNIHAYFRKYGLKYVMMHLMIKYSYLQLRFFETILNPAGEFGFNSQWTQIGKVCMYILTSHLLLRY